MGNSSSSSSSSCYHSTNVVTPASSLQIKPYSTSQPDQPTKQKQTTPQPQPHPDQSIQPFTDNLNNNKPNMVADVLISNIKKHLKSGKPAKEFMFLENEELDTDETTEAQKMYNREKNRYTNILPCDTTRVKLSLLDGVEGSDYINANFIDGETCNSERAYIATQGPLMHTRSDFWRMVWENNSMIIVMLGKDKENERVKCDRYWPESPEGMLTFGPLIVRSVGRDEDGGRTIIIRHMELAHTGTGEVRRITQYQYEGWPDHGVPGNAAGIRHLVKLVETSNKGITCNCHLHKQLNMSTNTLHNNNAGFLSNSTSSLTNNNNNNNSNNISLHSSTGSLSSATNSLHSSTNSLHASTISLHPAVNVLHQSSNAILSHGNVSTSLERSALYHSSNAVLTQTNVIIPNNGPTSLNSSSSAIPTNNNNNVVSNGPNSPLIVHCSAGVGRTGTFCTVHIALTRLHHDLQQGITSPRCNLYKTVLKLRRQRPGMVQQQEQYVFCYEAVTEEAEELGLVLEDVLVANTTSPLSVSGEYVIRA